MKAQARLGRYRDKQKNNGGDIDSFKKDFVRRIVQNPEMLQAMMKADPEGMHRLIERYAKDISTGIPVPTINQGVSNG